MNTGHACIANLISPAAIAAMRAGWFLRDIEVLSVLQAELLRRGDRPKERALLRCCPARTIPFFNRPAGRRRSRCRRDRSVRETSALFSAVLQIIANHAFRRDWRSRTHESSYALRANAGEPLLVKLRLHQLVTEAPQVLAGRFQFGRRLRIDRPPLDRSRYIDRVMRMQYCRLQLLVTERRVIRVVRCDRHCLDMHRTDYSNPQICNPLFACLRITCVGQHLEQHHSCPSGIASIAAMSAGPERSRMRPMASKGLLRTTGSATPGASSTGTLIFLVFDGIDMGHTPFEN